MAVPKTTETRCRDGSLQERQGMQTLHKYPRRSTIAMRLMSETKAITSGQGVVFDHRSMATVLLYPTWLVEINVYYMVIIAREELLRLKIMSHKLPRGL